MKIGGSLLANQVSPVNEIQFIERIWMIKYRVENERERSQVLTTALHMYVNIKTPTYICTHTKMYIYIPHIQTKTKYGCPESVFQLAKSVK